MLDAEQSVRPADLPAETTARLVADARSEHRLHPLATQLRVRAGADYVGYVRALLRGEAPDAVELGEYELRMFDNLGAMRQELRAREAEHGLARLVAGYAWDWRSRRDPEAFDIELDGERMRWNSTATDWISSPASVDEVGSIHTVQGYDLNYAGVIIGPDLRYDAAAGRIVASREDYRDKKGKENNPTLGRVYTDDDLLRFIVNVYAVLLTRGIRGTYVYVVDAGLREWMRGGCWGSRSAHARERSEMLLNSYRELGASGVDERLLETDRLLLVTARGPIGHLGSRDLTHVRGRTVIDQTEERIRGVQLVRERIGVTEISHVVRHQDVGAGVGRGRMHV